MDEKTPELSRNPLSIAEWIGIALMVLSFLLFWSILALPFVGDLGVHKGVVAGAMAIGGELVFWLGVLVAGRDFMRRYRDRFSVRQLIAWFNDRGADRPAEAAEQPPSASPDRESSDPARRRNSD